MYYNTLGHEGEELRTYKRKALTQDRVLYHFILLFPFEGYTPSELNRMVLPGTPVTSVRRSINTLTREGKLVKTGEQRTGPYGRPETVWRLVAPELRP
jgi:hypothetical protein